MYFVQDDLSKVPIAINLVGGPGKGLNGNAIKQNYFFCGVPLLNRLRCTFRQCIVIIEFKINFNDMYFYLE